MTDYGFDTNDIQLDKVGLPIGIYKVMINGEEINEKRALVVTYEVLEGEHKGKTGKVWYNINHENETTKNIARQAIKRIGDATGRNVNEAAPLRGRVLTVDVQQQKKNPDYTEIRRYLPENHKTDDLPFSSF